MPRDLKNTESQYVSGILYTFQIQPILGGGKPGNQGGYLEIGPDKQRIDSIVLQVASGVSLFSMSYEGVKVTGYDELALTSMAVSSSIFNPITTSTFNFVVKSNGDYNLGNPIIDVLRTADVFRVYYQSLDDDNPVPLLVGNIETIAISYDMGGLKINITVGGAINILARSALVQTVSELKVNNTPLISAIPEIQKFGDLLHSLLSETYANQTKISTKYYAGATEIIADSKPSEANPAASKGTGVTENTYMYVVPPVGASKLDVILQALYPYQRVIYMDTDGILKITPLTSYFDEDTNWTLSINKNDTLADNVIKIKGIYPHKNTALLQNRVYFSLAQSLVALNLNSSNIRSPQNVALNAISIATPTRIIFPRATDLLESGLGIQTSFNVMPMDINAAKQNTGLLDSGSIINNVQGTITGVKVDSNYNAFQSKAILSQGKFTLSLYAARKMAEILVNDLTVDVVMPLISTYDVLNATFKKIPLNQMVKIPTVQNNMFEGLNQLFCYGFSLRFSVSEGSELSLQLTKPYTFTAWWVNELVEAV